MGRLVAPSFFLLFLSGFLYGQTPTAGGVQLPGQTNFRWFDGDVGSATRNGDLDTNAGGISGDRTTGGITIVVSSDVWGAYYNIDVNGTLTDVYVFTPGACGNCWYWKRYEVERGPSGIPSTDPDDWTEVGNGYINKTSGSCCPPPVDPI